MAAFAHLFAGLLIAAVAWAIAFFCGSLLRTPKVRNAPAEDAVELLLTTGAGMALVGALTFVLGIVHAIVPVALPCLIALIALAAGLRGSSALRREFWDTRATLIRSAVRSAAAIMFAVSVIDALPATLPDRLEASLADYSVQAFELASVHGLAIDTLVRNGFYANNWSLIECWLFVFRLGDFAPFLTWLAGALCLTTIVALVVSSVPRAERRRVGVLFAAGGAAASLLLNPMFLTVNSGGMIDAQCGWFFLVTTYICARATRENDGSWFWPMALVLGFTVSMKVQFILLLPCFWLVLWALGRRLGRSVPAIVGGGLVTTAVALGWYVWTTHLGTPMFALMAVPEMVNYTHLLNALSGFDLVRLPFDIYANQHPNTFTSDGTTAICLLLMAPGAVMIWAVVTGTEIELGVIATVVFIGMVYWLSTPHQVRYALLYQAAYCALIGILFARGSLRWPRFAPAFVALAVLIAIPIPSSAEWFRTFIAADVIGVPAEYADTDTFLRPRAEGYREMEYLTAEFERLGRDHPHVYLMQLETLKFPFIKRGVTAIADGTGVTMHDAFAAAIDAGTARAFLDSLSADALIVPSNPQLTPAQRASLDEQTRRAGYVPVSCGGSIALYVKGDSAPGPCHG